MTEPMPPPDPAAPDEDGEPPDEDGEPPDDKSLLDRMRGTGVGVEDPNIVGDVGPTDVAPGSDPDAGADLE